MPDLDCFDPAEYLEIDSSEKTSENLTKSDILELARLAQENEVLREVSNYLTDSNAVEPKMVKHDDAYL